MATVAAIIERVQRRVIDLPTAVQAEVQTLVEDAHRTIQDLHNFKCMEGLASETTTAGDPSLGTITLTNFKDYRGDAYYTDDFGETFFLKVTHEEGEVFRGFNTDATLGIGRPRVLLHRRPTAVGDLIQDHEWRVYPVPDGLAQTVDGEYPIRIPYWSYLSFPASSDWFTDNATDFLINDATAEAFALNWDEARYAFWHAKAYGPFYDSRNLEGGDLRRAIRRDKLFILSTFDTIIPYDGRSSAKIGL